MRSARKIAVWLASLVAVIVGSIGIAGSTYEPDLTIPTGFAGRTVEVAGVPLRVLTEGSGRDLLMIHGSSGSIEDFDLQAEALAPDFRVTRYDRPGHGFSGDTGRYSNAHNAEVARALIDQLELERVVVVGHSYGGSTALALGLLDSPRVAAIVVIDSRIYTSGEPTKLVYRMASLPVFGIGLARILPRSVREKAVDEGFRALFWASPPPPGFLELRSRLWAEPRILHALARERVDLDDNLAQTATRYREIDVPIYFAVQRDEDLRREQAERLVRERPETILELVSETGHFIQVERPDVVTALIRRAADESAGVETRDGTP